MNGLLLRSNGLVLHHNRLLTQAGAECCCGDQGVCANACASTTLGNACQVRELDPAPFCCECGKRFRIHLRGTATSAWFWTRNWFSPSVGVIYAMTYGTHEIVIDATADWACVPIRDLEWLRVVAATGSVFTRKRQWDLFNPNNPPVVTETRLTPGNGLEEFMTNYGCGTQAATLFDIGRETFWSLYGFAGVFAYFSPPCTGSTQVQYPSPREAGTAYQVWENSQSCNFRRSSVRWYTPQIEIPVEPPHEPLSYVGEASGSFDFTWTLSRDEPCRTDPCPPGGPPPPTESTHGCCESRTRPPEVTTAAECFNRGILRWDQGRDCDGQPLPGPGVGGVPSLRRIAYLGSGA